MKVARKIYFRGRLRVEAVSEDGERSKRANRSPFLPPADASTPEELERARALLAAIVSYSEDAIVSKTLEGVVTSWNAAAERLFGFSADEMIGQSITRIIPEHLQHEEVDILAKLRKGERIERYETVRVRKDGEFLDISLTISPIRDSKGTIVGAAKIAHDVTARRRAERELQERETQLSKLLSEREFFLESERAARSEAERLSRLKDEFLATLSHELRTPLNAIQGWAVLLREGRVSRPEDYDRGLETIERNVRIQTQIVNDLLDMSRIISGKVHLEVQPLYLHNVVSQAIETVRETARAKNVRIHPLLDSSIGLVRGDPNRLQQVLWNLLTNAIKFTPGGGRVQVVLERVNSHVEISVEDTGIGIRTDFLPFVFDRFRQADPSTTRRYGGLGLGLSIVKSLVELHGGSVRVKSPGENLGSTFIVSLPVSHVRTDALPTGDASVADWMGTVELPRLDGVRVLVIDDEADGRMLTARILEAQGAYVACAASGVEALDVLSKERIDIVLSDIGMPDMDGLELIRHIRRLDKSRSGPVPAIALTAYARTEDRQRSLLAGFHMHLSKPIEARELIASISGLLHLSR
jgi:PAS domain S-box-containing protein